MRVRRRSPRARFRALLEVLDFGGRPRAEVITGDCREAMARMAPRSVDAIVTDPPYGLSFMGKAWDHAVPGPGYWAEALRVAKPGAHLLAFGGTRCWHRLACAIEDAGWEMRDSIAWMFGQGFPKANTQLKPAHEPIVLARAPFRGSAKRCVKEHGTGALNIEACRIPASPADVAAARVPQPIFRSPTGHVLGFLAGRGRNGETFDMARGRHPANVILDEAMAEALDEQSGHSVSSGRPRRNTAAVHNRTNSMGKSSGDWVTRGHDDSGGASRFFYCAKASTREREAGFGAPKGERVNRHPTVKPISLMRWLVRLVTPPGGLVLDPFTGSGSTGCAAALEGFDFLGIEQDPEHAELARKRIAHWGSL